MKRVGDIVSLFQKEAIKIRKRNKVGNMLDVVEELTKELVCIRVVIEGQTQEPTMSMSNVIIEQTRDVSPPPPPVYDFSRLKHDLGEMVPIANYHVNDQEAVRRAYILKKSFRPYAHDFEKIHLGVENAHSVLCSIIIICTPPSQNKCLKRSIILY
ncbi:hypothetical protein ZWY2020_054795 [Hordeum vulgare]|nr:hypothetical protein ZWY2020_054795 [Hordeum vulgare]